MASFEQTQAAFLDKWAKKEGASTQTIEDMKKAFAGLHGLLKYRGIADDLTRIDAALIDHYCSMLEGKGIARVEIEMIRTVMNQFIEFVSASQQAAKPDDQKAKAKEKPKESSGKPKRVTMKLGLLVFLDLVWIAAVLYFMFVTPNLSAGLQRTLIAFLVGLALILIIGLFRLFRAMF